VVAARGLAQAPDRQLRPTITKEQDMPAIPAITSSATRVARRVRSHLKPSPWMAVAVVAVAAGGGGLAYAAVTPGEISACSNKTSGALRIAATCTATENPVSWNAVGPQGATGPAGPVGPRGATGPKGADGVLATTSGVRDSFLPGAYDMMPSPDLVVTKTSRVIANASITVQGYNGGYGDGSGACAMALYAGTVYKYSLTSMWRDTAVASGEHESLALVGSAVVAPGTYRVHVDCSTYGAATLRGEFTAFAAAI
jgi:hypothetical protein